MQQEYANRKWTRKYNGYYQSTTIFEDGKRKWLHQYVWQEANGTQPKGWDVHHKDGNKDNNSLDNLELITRSAHQAIHGKEYFENNKEGMLARLEKIRPKAAAWHSSEEGLEWHRQHRENLKDKILAKDKERECAWCGKTVMSHLRSKNVYCDRKCEYKYTVGKSKTEGEEYECKVCGEKFRWIKEKATCSDECFKIHFTKSRKVYTHECVTCGKTFENGRRYNDKGHYCTQKCKRANEYVPKKFDAKPCKQCGELFTPKRKSSVYCGNECARVWNNKDRKNRN